MRQYAFRIEDGAIFVTPKPGASIDSIKDLGARRLKSGSFKLPLLTRNVDELVSIEPDSLTLREYQQLWDFDWSFAETALSAAQIPEDILYPFQLEAIEYLLASTKPGALLALSPRMGKTIVSLIALDMLGARNVLIVCPRILILSWVQTASLWLGRDLEWEKSGWRVVTYDYARIHADELQSRKWDYIVIDESSKIKSASTKRFAALMKIRKDSPQAKVWELSGLPITRYSDDLWAQFKMLWPGAFPSYWRFANDYCEVEDTLWGPIIKGSRDDRDLKHDYRDLMFVRSLDQELDLIDPDFELIQTPLLPQQRRLYKRALDEFIIELSSGAEMTIKAKLAQMTKLMQIASSASNLDTAYVESSKIEAVLEMVAAGLVEMPCLIWTNWRQTGIQLANRLGTEYKVSRVIGGDSYDGIDSYLQGKSDLLLLSLEVGQFGLTLANTRTVIYVDKTFHMESFFQSMYRVRTIHADHPYKVISLKAPDTIDELVEQNLAGKAVDIMKLTNAEFLSLLGEAHG